MSTSLDPVAGQTGTAAFGAAMKRRTPVAVWLGLPLITLGIYHIVWYYKIHKEMRDFDRRHDVPVVGPTLVMIFLPYTYIAPLISWGRTGRRIRNAQETAGLVPTCSPVLSWVLAFAFGANIFYMQKQLNLIVDHYAQAAPGTAVPIQG